MSEDHWQVAIQKAAPPLGLLVQQYGIETVLALVLGEAQFGPDRLAACPARPERSEGA